MPRRLESRSQDTKRTILAAAGQLFAKNGYEGVTMREIAKEAGCSHTTIYIYFKDKEALLHELSKGPLEALKLQMEAELLNKELSPADRLKSVGKKIHLFFCLVNRTMFNIFFHAKASRVDEEHPASEIQKLRNQLFAMLGKALKECLRQGMDDDALLASSRVYVFFSCTG